MSPDAQSVKDKLISDFISERSKLSHRIRELFSEIILADWYDKKIYRTNEIKRTIKEYDQIFENISHIPIRFLK